MKHIVIGALALFVISQFSAIAQKRSFIRLAEIDGRSWLVTPEGKPFFSHGITHLSNQRAKIDFARVSKVCKEMGFNAYGYGCPDPLRSDMPYVESWNHLVPISYYRGKNGVRFVDVFDPKVQARLDAGVKANCFRSKKNPNAIGYCWTDLGSWPLKNPSGRNWVDFMRDLPEEAPGRKAYQKFLSEWKGDNAMARDKAFLRLIAREYFRVIGGAQRKYDPDHLVFGDRFAFNTLVPEVLEEMLPYVDGIAIQPSFWGPFPKKKFDEIHQLTGKPIILCDFAIRFKDGDKDVRMWKLENDSVAAGKAYADYVRAALKTDYVVGVFWCNPVDTPKGFGKSGVKQGFFGEGLTPRPGLGEAVIELNRHIAQVTPGASAAPKMTKAPKAPTKAAAEAGIIGNPEFIHLQKDNGVWWLADHTGKRFITTGMNHIGEGGVLFNEVNKGWLTGKFGADIKGSWGGLNPRAKGMGGYADMVVKDFKDHAFNTIPFHAYSTPLHHYEERKIYYVAKIKVQNISLQSMNRARGQRFPDVFSETFRDKLDTLAKRICTPLRDAKYCLGYSYFDMPDLKPMRPWQRFMFPDRGLVYPWVQDMRALPANAGGKQAWMRILKQNHASASAAAEVYALKDIASWEDLAKVTDWPIKPNDVPLVKKDAEDMLIALADKWYGLHHELIRKYDPNHLLLGDKHDVGYDKSVHMISDGILNVIGKYNDVLMIQYYSFYTDQHNATLQKLHQGTGLPIINGDHSYSYKSPKHTKIKGLELESHEAVANEYRRYLKGIMEDHPYMLGWWYCGYIEQWAPAGTKQLGQQCGFFSPFGEPNSKLLPVVKEANLNASKWHGAASANSPLPAWKPTPSSTSATDRPRPRKSAPSTPAEMYESLQLTAEQRTQMDALEKERKAAVTGFQKLNGEAKRNAENDFYTERKKKLQKIFTEKQWGIWTNFWNRNRNR